MPEQAQNAERESEQAQLQAAEHAFAAGDYRALQPKLQALQGSQSESVVTRVQALRRAISIDPIHLALLLACLLALVVIAARESTHELGLRQRSGPSNESVVCEIAQGADVKHERT